MKNTVWNKIICWSVVFCKRVPGVIKQQNKIYFFLNIWGPKWQPSLRKAILSHTYKHAWHTQMSISFRRDYFRCTAKLLLLSERASWLFSLLWLHSVASLPNAPNGCLITRQYSPTSLSGLTLMPHKFAGLCCTKSQ